MACTQLGTVSTARWCPAVRTGVLRRSVCYIRCQISSKFLHLFLFRISHTFNQVGVVAFSDNVYTSSADPCYASQLSVVNPTTSGQLKNFVNNLQAESAGDSNYTRAFEKAFSLLQGSMNTSSSATKCNKSLSVFG
jgi:hypothetical protein